MKQEIERLRLWQKVMEDQRPRLAWNNEPIETERERERERKGEKSRIGKTRNEEESETGRRNDKSVRTRD